QSKSDSIDRKMQQIIARKKRQEERKLEKEGKAKGNQVSSSSAVSVPSPTQKPKESLFVPGAQVCIKGESTIGTFEERKGKKAIVLFGQIRTTLPLDMLEEAPKMKKAPTAAPSFNSFISRQTLDQMHQTQLNFRPEIDVRGMRGDEAIQTVTAFIDDATLVGAARVRILHGTGNGILRTLIRQHLRTVPQILSARDEHVQFGGAGITVIEFR
ncbi:MAG: Smr/MutS family protein, partial [Bacteroidaceae bacterium]|nr:Smr/MutS family protein [Bacteroidaceae bacterium]